MPVEFAESNPGSGGVKFAVDNITQGSDTLSVPYVKLMSGADAAGDVIPGTATNGLLVDVSRVQGNVSVTQGGSWSVNQSGVWNVNAAQSGTWTVNSAQSGDWTVNAVQSGAWTVSASQSGTWTVNAAQSGSWVVGVNNAVKIQDGQIGSGIVKTAFVNATAAGNTTIVAAVPSKKIRVLGYRIQAQGTVNVKFVDSTPQDLTFTWKLQDREGVVSSAPIGAFEFETAVGASLQVNLSASVQTGAQVIYVEV